MPSSILDTRTAFSGENTRLKTDASESLNGSTGLTFFRRLVHELLESSQQDRSGLRERVSERLRSSRNPFRYIKELLFLCATSGGTEGLDTAIDVLSNFGTLINEYESQFWMAERERWEHGRSEVRHHMNDDAWYVLLRAAAASDLPKWQKISMFVHCLSDGTPSIREAAIHALGDLGGPDAVDIIRNSRSTDASLMVRQTADEVLGDLEG